MAGRPEGRASLLLCGDRSRALTSSLSSPGSRKCCAKCFSNKSLEKNKHTNPLMSRLIPHLGSGYSKEPHAPLLPGPPAPFGATRCGRLRTDSRCSSGSNPITLRPAERPHRQTGSFRGESYGLLILPSLKDLVPPSSEMKKKSHKKTPQPHTGKSLRKRAPKRGMKAGLRAAASARSQGSPLRSAGVSLPPPALRPGSPMTSTARQPAFHCSCTVSLLASL